jgi:hypothetical protein
MVPMADDVVVDEGKLALVMCLDEDNSERATKIWRGEKQMYCTRSELWEQNTTCVTHISDAFQ